NVITPDNNSSDNIEVSDNIDKSNNIDKSDNIDVLNQLNTSNTSIDSGNGNDTNVLPGDLPGVLPGVLPKGSYEQLEMTESRFLSEEAKGHHKIIGQIFNTYWITEYDGAIYFMDQHAAHEKVNFERFKAEFESRTILSQNIYPSIIISLSSIEKQAAIENVEYLSKYGFVIEDFGGNDIKLSGLPANLIGLDGREVFMELVAYLADDIKNVTEDIFIRKLASMGCKAAIKGNQVISEYEAGMLIEQLMKLKDPYTCPHGRPTLIRMTKDEVDKKFKRIVE
nr:DNA mismatch repair protein MutL [Eubacterium sp.]